MACQVQALYKLVKFDCGNIKQASYQDAWDLRRLYTFAFRRQLDAKKRNQIPRDWDLEWPFCFHDSFLHVYRQLQDNPAQDEKLGQLFQKIASYRKKWEDQQSLLEEDARDDVPIHHDDEGYKCASTAPAAGRAPSVASSNGADGPKSPDQVAAEQQLVAQLQDLKLADVTEEQKVELMKIMMDIEEEEACGPQLLTFVYSML